MQQDKFSLLRTILKTLGLSQEAIDDIIGRITDFLSDKEDKAVSIAEYPYLIRDDFLSPAEQNFFQVLKLVVSDSALICPKVSLGDLFYAKSSDPSKHRSLTNKIDRKHVDFLLCDLKTVRPIVGIELDDKSHERSEQQLRDALVEKVFESAKLPLIRVPVRRSYTTSELEGLLNPYLIRTKETDITLSPANDPGNPPRCPRCGSDMVLRKAKFGVNPGEQFWGCVNFPKCRGIVKYEPISS